MIEKRITDLRTYNELVDSAVSSGAGRLKSISNTILTFKGFGNEGEGTTLVVLEMLASAVRELDEELKSAAVSLSQTKDVKISDREIANAVGVSPTTLAKWISKSEVPEWMNSEED